MKVNMNIMQLGFNIDEVLCARYRKYLTTYDNCDLEPSSCIAGHLQELSWIMHELLGYSDKDIRNLEDEIRGNNLKEE